MTKEVNIKYINEVIENSLDHWGELIFALDGNVWVACDNSDGNAWTEEFKTKEEAIHWLTTYWESEQ